MVSVQLTIWPEPGVGQEYMTLPKDGSVIWNNQTYSISGNYEYHTTTIHGCDSTAWLHLSDKPVYDSTELQTVCAGEPILWYEGTLTPTETDNVFMHRITGTETDTLITLTVTIRPIRMRSFQSPSAKEIFTRGTEQIIPSQVITPENIRLHMAVTVSSHYI